MACDSVITHRCPSDSVLVYNDSISNYECCQRNFECQCDLSLCKVPRCAPGHAPSLLRKSYNKPGFCCDLYQCKVSGKLLRKSYNKPGFCCDLYQCKVSGKLLRKSYNKPGFCCDLYQCKISGKLLRKSYNKPGFCCDLYQCKVSGKHYNVIMLTCLCNILQF